jgi:hypothetical protein
MALVGVAQPAQLRVPVPADAPAAAAASRVDLPPSASRAAPPPAGLYAGSVLAVRAIEAGPEPEATPDPEATPELEATPDPAPPPPPFEATVEEVSALTAHHSTWRPGCPVGRDQLRHVTVTHWGFDGEVHVGDTLIHRSAAEDIVWVFEQLYEARFPIEELRIIQDWELTAPPTGDTNASSAFVCRRSVGSARWSDHAYGLALDLNPLRNPYVRGDVIIPHQGAPYVDRANHRPGMIQPGDAVVRAFAEIGWAWGGDWKTAKDWMHFSASGR